MVSWQDSLRFLWNLAHEQRLAGLQVAKDHRRYPTAFDQINELTELRAELPWLADVPRNVSANLLSSLDLAWRWCFKKLSGRPRWKRKSKDGVGLCETHPKVWKLDGDILRFPKLGSIRIRVHRPLEGKPKTCTLVQDGDLWHAVIVCEIELPEPESRCSPVVAIDRGLVIFGATSDGEMISNPKFLERSQRRLAHAERVVARRKKGSKNREKAKLRVARIHRKIRNRRICFLHALSRRFADSQGVVVLEKLDVADMMKGRNARSIADASWSRFAKLLRYKLVWNGGHLIEVPAAYSSQTCSSCGHTDGRSRRSQAVFVCTRCCLKLNADFNASLVLLARANRSGLPVEGSLKQGTLRSRKLRSTVKCSSEKLSL